MHIPGFIFKAAGLVAVVVFLQTGHARNYDPKIGRFLQEDPSDGHLARPISHINKYVYVENDPMGMIDPFGSSGMKIRGNYCGQGYSVPGSTPRDELDEACQTHDEYTSGSLRGNNEARTINRGQADMKLSYNAFLATPYMIGSNPTHRPVDSAYGTYKTLDVGLTMGGLGMMQIGWATLEWANDLEWYQPGQIVGGLVLIGVGLPAFVVGPRSQSQLPSLRTHRMGKRLSAS